MIVIKPYRNWKDAKTDQKINSVTEGQVVAKAKQDAFLQTYSKPVSQIDFGKRVNV